MATLATDSLRWLAREWEKVYGSAVLSGIVGDLAHKARGGYHISRQDQPSTNYSVVRPDDKPGNGPNDRAAAIDMTMSTADMIRCHTRMRNLWKNRAKDPRFKYINAWNGWDGQGDAGRYDVITGSITTATADHKWHIHLEIRRKYVNDMNAMRAILSIIKGEPIPTTSRPAPITNSGDDDMTQDEFTKFFLNAINNEAVAAQLRARPWQYVGGGLEGAGSALKSLGTIYLKVNGIAEAVAAIAQKVDLDPAEIEALKAALAVPTAEANAEAVVSALGGLDVDQLSEILHQVLTPQAIADLKAAL